MNRGHAPADDFHDHEPSGCEHPRDPGPVGSGAFDTDSIDGAVRPQEAHQFGVAGLGRVELAVSDAAAQVVHNGYVMGKLVGVDPGDQQHLVRCVGGDRHGWHARQGRFPSNGA